MSYFADAGPRSGPILYRNAVDRAIGGVPAPSVRKPTVRKHDEG
jgi:hypothetical protein